MELRSFDKCPQMIKQGVRFETVAQSTTFYFCLCSSELNINLKISRGKQEREVILLASYKSHLTPAFMIFSFRKTLKIKC